MTDISQLPGAFLFDLDGVLTPTLDVHKRAWKTLFAEVLPPFVPPYTDDDYNRLVDGRPRYDGVRNVLESRGIHLPEGAPDDGVDDDTVCGLGNRKDALFNQELARGMTAYPGSLGLLDYLGTGCRMGVVSSSRNARAVLAAAGLGGRFAVVVDGIVAAECNLAGKPAPDTYLYAARQLGVPPGQAAVVEDALGGVEAGAAGGFGLVIGVDRGAGREALLQHGASVVVDDLAEVIPLVVGCVPAHAQKDHPDGSAATPPKEGNEAEIPLLRRGGSREATDGVVQIPLLRRGGRPEGSDGVVGCVPAHAQNDHPGGSAATPPKEGNEAEGHQ